LRAELEAAGMTTCPPDTQIAGPASALGATPATQPAWTFNEPAG
jgi:hypothetical protein